MKTPKNFKNIYVQTFWISMSTYAAGIFLVLLGGYGGGITLAVLGLILVWPLQIFTLVEIATFDPHRINISDGQTPFLLYAVVQYIGYFWLLIAVRKIKVLYKKKKAAKLGP